MEIANNAKEYVKPKTSKDNVVNLAAAKKNLDEQRVEDARIVRGKFNYIECPGGILEFSFKKYKGDPIVKYSLKDGEVYSIPLMVAKHLNTNCAYPSYTFKNDEAGRPQTTVAEMIRRTSFQNLEF